MDKYLIDIYPLVGIYPLSLSYHLRNNKEMKNKSIVKNLETAKNQTDFLEKFRINYPSIRVMVYDDYMVYSVADGWADRAATVATELISKMQLPLIATPTFLQRKNSFCITYKAA